MELCFSGICPRCRMVCISTDSLHSVPALFFCPVCQMTTQTNFAENIVFSTRLPPSSLASSRGIFCASGPGNARHVLLQQLVESKERREILIEASSSCLLLQTEKVQFDMQLTSDVSAALPTIILRPDGGIKMGTPVASGKLVIENHDDHPRFIRISRQDMLEDADRITASKIILQQSFAHLFPCDAPEVPLLAGDYVYVSARLSQAHLVYASLDAEAAARLSVTISEQMAQIVREYQGSLIRENSHEFVLSFADGIKAIDFSFETVARLRDLLIKSMPEMDDSRSLLSIGISQGSSFCILRNGVRDLAGFDPALASYLSLLAQAGEVLLVASLAEESLVAERIAPHIALEKHVHVPDQTGQQPFKVIPLFSLQ